MRVVDRPDAEPLIDVAALLSPRSYVVRVYVLTGESALIDAGCHLPSTNPACAGHDFTPHDDNGKNDPCA